MQNRWFLCDLYGHPWFINYNVFFYGMYEVIPQKLHHLWRTVYAFRYKKKLHPVACIACRVVFPGEKSHNHSSCDEKCQTAKRLLFSKNAAKTVEYTIFSTHSNIRDLFAHKPPADIAILFFCLGIFSG